MRKACAGFLLCLVGLPGVRPVKGRPPPAASGAPTTLPGSDAIAALITRLGDADFRVRREASNQLREIGPAALPRLNDARASRDPEIRARASVLVRELERHPVPGRPLIHSRTSSANYAIINGRQSINIDDEGRKIHILQGTDGIRMIVAGEVNGRPATETYHADSAADLRSSDPEAFALYDRIVRRFGLDGPMHGGINPTLPRGNVVLPAATGGDDLRLLRARLDAQMDKAALKPAQRRRVIDAMKKIDDARQATAAAGNDQDRQIEQYDHACDGLRQIAAQLRLPDPGAALPPPQSARLGVSVMPEDGTDRGIVVAHVVAHSRADRLGIQDDDVIRKVNGKPVTSVAELRALLTQHARGLIVEINRDGRPMQLRGK